MPTWAFSYRRQCLRRVCPIVFPIDLRAERGGDLAVLFLGGVLVDQRRPGEAWPCAP